MRRETPAVLMSEHPAPIGVFQTPALERRTVYGHLRSVGYRERYEAAAHGLEPELILALAHDFEYRNERLCEVQGVQYRVLRTYLTGDGIELTLERVRG